MYKDFDISHECSLRQNLSVGKNSYDLVTLMFDLHIENVNFGYNF
jgi:hypothetical protein